MTDPIFIGGLDGVNDISAAVVGTKGANLARLDRLGFRVPAALALDTGVCRAFAAGTLKAEELRAALVSGIRRLERATGLAFGSSDRLLLSIRSSPPVSMPGMLETVMDVGLSEDGVRSLICRTGNPWLAWDAYRRLIRSFAATVYRLPRAPFERLAAEVMARVGARTIQELDPEALRDVARRSRKLLESLAAVALPQDPIDQVLASVRALFTSWYSDKAREHRRLNGFTDETGTAVLVQTMVFGDAGPCSGSGVGFTRNPATGDDSLYVDFAFNAQGDDVVSGRCPLIESAMLRDSMPEVWRELLAAKSALEGEFLDMHEFEFTIEEGQLYFLQSRTGRRTAAAAVQIARDMVRDGLIDTAVALERVSVYDLSRLVTTVLRLRSSDAPLASAIPVNGGAATGRIALDAQRARDLAADGSVILLSHELNPEDFSGLAAAAGFVTTLGARTSQAAVLARQLGKVGMVGCSDLEMSADASGCILGGRALREGDMITLDGETGWIYAGAVPATTEERSDALATVEKWRRGQAEAISRSWGA